jgi:small subunit ribosomal protein S18
LARVRTSRLHRTKEDFHTVAKQRKSATKPARRRDTKKGGPGSGRRKPCPYCKDKIEQVDYKNVGDLRRFVSERGKIRSRRITGACRRHQSQIATAVKRARELALLPYAAEPASESVGGRRGRDRDRERE